MARFILTITILLMFLGTADATHYRRAPDPGDLSPPVSVPACADDETCVWNGERWVGDFFGGGPYSPGETFYGTIGTEHYGY